MKQTQVNDKQIYIDGVKFNTLESTISIETDYANTSFLGDNNQTFHYMAKKRIIVDLKFQPIGFTCTEDSIYLYTQVPLLSLWKLAYANYKGLNTDTGKASLFFDGGFKTPEALAFKAGYEVSHECKLEDYEYE